MKHDKTWWQHAVIYQIYPRSFQDTTGNGTGDLRGIIQRLDYVASLNVDAVWISPFYPSPMADFGYDVSDFCNIDPIFGTLDDFKMLLDAAHDRGLKLLMDQVWCHTSDQHPWFQNSIKNGDKSDWYVWVDAKENGQPPNNWLATFGGTAWTWHPERQQYYLHHFLQEQPALNWYNPDVQAAMLNVGRFWLDMGVDGFRFDVVNFLMHDELLRDNPLRTEHDPIPAGGSLSIPFFKYINQYNIGQAATHEMVKVIRFMLDEYDSVTSLAEISSAEDALKEARQCVGSNKLHMAYNSSLITEEPLTAQHLREILNDAKALVSQGGLCWTAGTHDFPRVASRWRKHFLEDHFDQEAFNFMLAVLLVALPGSCCLYQGDELGLPEAELAFEDLRDPYGINNYPDLPGRDGCRTPMPWNAQEKNFGFSIRDKPWLPLADNHQFLAVDQQEQSDESLLNKYRSLTLWRKTQPALSKSLSIKILNVIHQDLLVFVRGDDTEKPLLFIINLSDRAVQFNFEDLPVNNVSQHILCSGFEEFENKLQLSNYGFYIAEAI